MKVELLNPDEVRDVFKNHGQFACVCYGTDESKAERVGKACMESGHMSGSRCEYIKFRISDIDRGTAEQIMRHEVGVRVAPDEIVKNMASFRYIDKDDFEWATPRVIEADRVARQQYDDMMELIAFRRRALLQRLEKNGVGHAQAVEAVNMVLPRATLTQLCIGFTPEALIHFCHKRLCSRAQEFIRAVAWSMVHEVDEVNPELADRLVPQCEYLLWCPEGKKSCGLRPTKEKLRKMLHIGETTFYQDGHRIGRVFADTFGEPDQVITSDEGE